jgi:hypothetical protein
MFRFAKSSLLLALTASMTPAHAQPLTTDTSVPYYSGGGSVDGSRHDGGLRPVVGVNLYQVTRGTGLQSGGTPSFGDKVASDIRHHPNIAYWNNRYWVQYLPASEAVLATSTDGIDWTHATAFDDLGTIRSQDVATHHRASFYVDQPTGKLLTSTFYGTRQSPNNAQGGFARAVREVTGVDANGKPTFGQSYGLLYNKGFETINELDPFTESADANFVAAANRMLDNKLYSQQFYEEHQDQGRRPTTSNGSTTFSDYGFVLNKGNTPGSDLKAFNYWTLPDGRVAATWKGVTVGVTDNGTDGWVESNIAGNLVEDQRTRDPNTGELNYSQFGWHGTAKVWGQSLPDGADHNYAIIGNFQTTEPDGRRFPLVISTSDDGIEFNGEALTIDGETPIHRYADVWPQDHKDGGGAQYIRGIVEGNPRPDDATWLTYSSNKEDIWVARVPNQISGQVDGPINDDFEGQAVGGLIEGWNTYSPVLSPVRVVDDGGNKLLRLQDADPYDYAKATRVFQPAATGEVSFRLRQSEVGDSGLYMDVQDASGNRAVQLALSPTGELRALDGPPAAVDFAGVTLTDYDGQSGQSGRPSAFSVEDNGRTLQLQGNTWRKLALDYNITESTVLAFDFMSTRQGEIHGVGFDTNNDLAFDQAFKVFGTDHVSIPNTGIEYRYFDDYVLGSGWQSYRIDVGNFFQGQIDELVFFNDDDANRGTDIANYGNSAFRDVRLFDDDGSTFTLLSQIDEDQWVDITVKFNAETDTFDVWIDGQEAATALAFAEAADTLERISFTTGDYRGEDMGRRPIGEMWEDWGSNWLTTDLPDADTPVNRSTFDIDNVRSIPEPGTAALLGVGAAGLMKRRHRGTH